MENAAGRVRRVSEPLRPSTEHGQAHAAECNALSPRKHWYKKY